MNELPEFAAPSDGTLSADMLAAFEETGVIILRGFETPEACERVRSRALKLVDGFDPAQKSSVFSTTNNQQLSDAYFFASGSNISFFLEEEATMSDGALQQAKEHSINKMGHAMHDLDPVFDAFSRTSKLANAAASLGYSTPLIVQSMYIFKPPGIGGEVVCHQDSTYLFTDPETCIGFWFAIDDATEENGCMRFIPGGHKEPLREINRRNGDGGSETTKIDPTPFDVNDAVAAPAQTGDLVIFHGRAPHMSAANRSRKTRHAYTLHMVDAAAKWPRENWLQRPANLPFRGF